MKRSPAHNTQVRPPEQEDPSQEDRINAKILDAITQDPQGLVLLQMLGESIERRTHAPGWSMSDTLTVYEAYELAEFAHRDQKRLNGDSHLTHSLEIAVRLAIKGAPPTLIAAALLHDGPEDQPELVIQYIQQQEPDIDLRGIDTDNPTSEDALAALAKSDLFRASADYVRQATREPYPQNILDMKPSDEKDEACIAHQLRAVQALIEDEDDPNGAWLRFEDFHANTGNLERDVANMIGAYESSLNGETPGDLNEIVQKVSRWVKKDTALIELWRKEKKPRHAHFATREILAACEASVRGARQLLETYLISLEQTDESPLSADDRVAKAA